MGKDVDPDDLQFEVKGISGRVDVSFDDSRDLVRVAAPKVDVAKMSLPLFAHVHMFNQATGVDDKCDVMIDRAENIKVSPSVLRTRPKVDKASDAKRDDKISGVYEGQFPLSGPDHPEVDSVSLVVGDAVYRCTLKRQKEAGFGLNPIGCFGL